MYSMVLMMALNSGATAPDTFFSHGCNGCQGACVGACVGNGCAGACVGACGGCGGHRLFNGGFCGHLFRRNGCAGCAGCAGYACAGYGCAGYGCAGVIVQPAKPAGTGEKLPPPKPNGKGAMVPAPAKLIVSLPADAKLTIDNQPTVSTSETRVFASPVLTPGRDYFYTLKAEIVRDGNTDVVEKRVTVRAGQESTIKLDFPVAVTAAK